jgi:ketosteroid isomerase-like protein
MDIKTFVEDWIKAANCYDTEKYLSFYCQNAVLDDPSVGSTFQTQTKLLKLSIQGTENAYVEVAFSGNFPEGNLRGTFDFNFKDEKIAFVKAEL